MSPEEIKNGINFLRDEMRKRINPRVLIVEDRQDDVDILVHELKRFKCEIVIAMSAEEAQRLLSEPGISIVFLDLKLPIVEGVEVIKQNRKLDAGTHFVIVTGSKDLGSVNEALRAGAVITLEKPVTYEMLAQFLEPRP